MKVVGAIVRQNQQCNCNQRTTGWNESEMIQHLHVIENVSTSSCLIENDSKFICFIENDSRFIRLIENHQSANPKL